MNLRALLLPTLLSGALSACTILPESEPLDVYRLPGGEFASAERTTASGPTVRVLRPSSSTQLAGRAIVVIPDDRRISVYQNSAWTDPVPLLLRERIIDALRADGHMAAVSSDVRSLQADLELDGNVRAFQSEYRNGQPEVVVRIDVQLIHSGNRQILASHRFETREAATDTAVPAVVDSFGIASDRIAQEIAQWAVQNGGGANAR